LEWGVNLGKNKVKTGRPLFFEGGVNGIGGGGEAKACKVQYKTTVTDVEENKKRK